jgi:hypothetical protein
MGINYKGSQGQTKRAVVLQEEEVCLVGVLSHFIYLEDARNHRTKIHRGKTGKEHLRVQEHQV